MSIAALHPDDNELAREDLIARGWAALPPSYRIPDKAPTALPKPAPGANTSPKRTTKISMLPHGSCRRLFARTSMRSTPTAASPTI